MKVIQHCIKEMALNNLEFHNSQNQLFWGYYCETLYLLVLSLDELFCSLQVSNNLEECL